MGSRPFLKQLLKKMSAKLGAMMARKPYCSIAQGACSREEPQPKVLAPAWTAACVARLVQHEVRIQLALRLRHARLADVE